MAKIIGITEQEKAKLIKLRDTAITALAKFCDALDASFGDDAQGPVKKTTKRAKKDPTVEGEAKTAALKAPVNHPGMKVVKKGANGAAHAEQGLAEL